MPVFVCSSLVLFQQFLKKTGCLVYLGDEILPSYIYIYIHIIAYIYISRDYMGLLKKKLPRIHINQPVFNGKYGRFFFWVAQLDPTGCTWKDLGNPGPHHMGISVGCTFWM